MRIAVVLPPSRTSHEVDTLRAIPGAEVIVIADPDYHSVATHPVQSWRLPWLGSPRRWTAALAWLRGVDDIDLGGTDHRIDVVVSLELFSVGTRQAARLARRLNARLMVYVTEILDRNPIYRLPPWRWYARRSVEELEVALCWNSAGARHAIARGVPADRVVVVSPGVDTSIFHPPPVGTDRPPVAISVGELREDKGVMNVIAATDRAVERLPDDFRLVLVGDGPLRSDVERAAQTRPWLEVRGRIPRAEVGRELRAAGAFVLAPTSRPFWAEQLCFAMLEAMACGLPVVVTDCGALSEVAPPHNAIVAEGDLDAFADGIVAALGPQGSEWGELNLAEIEAKYNLATQSARLGEALSTALEQRRPPR